MENKDYKEERFDAFLNKTIILSVKWYYRSKLNILEHEQTIIDDVCSSTIFNNAFFTINNDNIDNVETKLVLEYALKQLSDLEQAVIFLLFEKDLKLEDAGNILKLYSTTVSKIKNRALKKLEKLLKGGLL